MKIIRDKVEGDTVLTEGTQLLGMIVGNLILEKGCTVDLHGMVNGDVINKGGVLQVLGIVNGRIVRQGGETVVDSKALVRNGIR